jgi:ubiquinone/menaquinone biosynthesis C-methylase UbiE
MIISSEYIDPINKSKLIVHKNLLFSKKKKYPVIYISGNKIVNFLKDINQDKFYNKISFYKNYLDWLSSTLRMSLNEIRTEIFNDIKIKKNGKVLFIGCGMGDEIDFFYKKYKKKTPQIHGQDFSKKFILKTAKKFKNKNIKLTISDAHSLPYKGNYFDLVFHFGGINQFKDIKKAIFEMSRVCKKNGEIFFSDEGMGPWRKKTKLYLALKENNSLWSKTAPIHLLPKNSKNVKINWILKNNFYTIKFKTGINENSINPDIVHKSPRGGSIRIRYEKKYKKKLIL